MFTLSKHLICGLYLKNMGNNEINYQKLTQYTQKTSKKYLLMSKVF